MSHLLLFYDTKEKDLARDLGDFIAEHDVEIKMIPRSPESGLTLDQKEQIHIENASGVVVLVTPGSKRDGKDFPSPSVNHEMGQVKQRFKDAPASIIYLVENGCGMPAVDQTCYIPFNRSDMRSVVEALTHLVRNLKASGAIGRPKIIPQETPGVNIEELAAKLAPRLTEVCVELSAYPNGWMSYVDFQAYLLGTHQRDQQKVNFTMRDLQTMGLVTFTPAQPPSNFAFWRLTNIGWEVARIEQRKRDEERQKLLQERVGSFFSMLEPRKEQLELGVPKERPTKRPA